MDLSLRSGDECDFQANSSHDATGWKRKGKTVKDLPTTFSGSSPFSVPVVMSSLCLSMGRLCQSFLKCRVVKLSLCFYKQMSLDGFESNAK